MSQNREHMVIHRAPQPLIRHRNGKPAVLTVPTVPVPAGDKGEIVVSSSGLLWQSERYTYLHGIVADGSDQSAALNAALAAISTANGQVRAILPPGVIGFLDTVEIPDNIHLSGCGMDTTILRRLENFSTGDPILDNENASAADYISVGIRISDLTIENAWQNVPAWLSNSSGVAITDPEADYRVGGCLAPTSIATLSLTVTSGQLTGVSITSAGSGYTHKPAVWITDVGGGIGGQINITISGGQVTGASIAAAGRGYVTPVAEVAGGGANPVTALYAANRRNPNYDTGGGAAVRLRGTLDTVIERVRFTGHQKWGVNASGTKRLVIRDCVFEDVGKSDATTACFRYAANGSLPSIDGVFERNLVIDSKRLVCLLDGTGCKVRFNTVRGARESCFYVANYDSSENEILYNDVSNVRTGDIVCTFVECQGNVTIIGNRVKDVDGELISMSGGQEDYKELGLLVSDNILEAVVSRATTKPFGPFGERVAYEVGTQPVAGEQVAVADRAVMKYKTQGASAAIAPVSLIAARNRISTVSGGEFTYFLGFQRGAANAQQNIQLLNNVGVGAPLCELYDADALDGAFDLNSSLVVEGNVGFVNAQRMVWRESIAGESRVDDASLQNIFASNGTFTLRAYTTYDLEFDGYLLTGSTSHDLSFSLAGTATISRRRLQGESRAGTLDTVLTTTYSSNVDTDADAMVLVSASTNARKWVRIKGVIDIGAGGTVIPQFQLSAVSGGSVTWEQGTKMVFTQRAPLGGSRSPGVS